MTRIVPRSELPSAQRPAEDAVRLTVGTRLGRYELLCPIAEGGMAQVWAAEQTGDLGFRKLIALKTIRPDFAYHPSFRAMFLDEAQLASRIRHVNVVEVLDLGVDGDVVFQAMALVDGVAASEWLRNAKGGIPVGAAVRIAIDILHGLHAAHTLKDDDGHSLGLVHRDVSPQNVLIGSDGVAKLADFGIAKAFGRAAEETVVGDVKGKLAYVAPEQLRGLPAAPQSDLYSAGVVFWELLTSSRLFPIGNDSAEKRRHLEVRDPRTVVPSLPAPICAIVMRALNENPLERYDSSLEMADALEDAARSEGLSAAHRAVATALERDVGRKMESMRERLRQAKKRAGGSVTPTPRPIPTPRNRITGPVEPPAPPVEHTAVLPIPPPAPLPATRVLERQDFPTDTVTIAETPRPVFAAPTKKSSNGTMLPLALAAGLMLVLAVAIAVWGPPAQRSAAPLPPAPVVTALPAAEPPPSPVVTTAPPAPAPAAPPAASVSVAPAPHRPPLPHGRTRTAPAPKPAPAQSPTIAPRFESPY